MKMPKWLQRRKKPVWLAPETKGDEPSTIKKKDGEQATTVLGLLGQGDEMAPGYRLAEVTQRQAKALAATSKPTHYRGKLITGDSSEAVEEWNRECGPSGSCGSNMLDAVNNTDWSGINIAAAEYLGTHPFIGHLMASQLAMNATIDKACMMPARDAVRNGWEPRTVDGDEVDNADVLRLLRRVDQKMNVRRSLQQFIYKGRVFGVRVAVFKVKSSDKQYYEKPFNPDAVKPGKYEGIVQVDPQWCVPELDSEALADPLSAHFYEPTWWVIQGRRVHRSHVVVYRHGDLADAMRPAYLYGGIPLPQMIMEQVYAAQRTAAEAPMLAMTKRTSVLKLDVKKFAADAAALMKSVLNWVRFRNNMGVELQDKDNEYQQFDTSLADLDNVIMTSYQLVAMAAHVPATRLLETPPKGFNASGENEQRNYTQTLESLQEMDCTPFLRKHYQLAMLSEVDPVMRRTDAEYQPMDIGVVWNPCDTPTAKEQAEISKIDAETDTIRMDQGAVDEYDVREKMIKSQGAGWEWLPRVERPERADEDGDGEADEPVLQRTQQAAPAPTGDALDIPNVPDVQLWSNQRYLDPLIVDAKRLIKDYTVQVSGILSDPDNPELKFRIVIDGHHSLAAAREDGVEPVLVEGDYAGTDYQPVDALWQPV